MSKTHAIDEGEAARLKYEGGPAHDSIFAPHPEPHPLPEPLPVDHHDHERGLATAAHEAAAALPDHHHHHHGHHEAAAAIEAAMESGGHAEGVPALPPGLHPNDQTVHHQPATQFKIPTVPTPMSEHIPPDKWMGRFKELKAYKEENGTFSLPPDYKYKQLSSWVRTQKQQYRYLKEGKANHMSQVRIELLNSIGFEWAGERRDKFWHDRYAELAAFHARHGTTRIPPEYKEHPQLHTWVSLQRRQLKIYREGGPTKLTEERIRLLEAVGLEIKIRSSTTWMDRFMELKRYKEEHGTCDIPQKFKANPSLGRWVDNQKTQHQKLYDGKPTHMTIERIQLLVSIGFNWRRK